VKNLRSIVKGCAKQKCNNSTKIITNNNETHESPKLFSETSGDNLYNCTIYRKIKLIENDLKKVVHIKSDDNLSKWSECTTFML
jgi:hypothetical protein